RGYRYHCQAASDATHKIPISGFHLSRTCYPVVIRELLQFAQPARGVCPRFYCKSDDRFRISWCLERMASVAGVESPLELLTVEDLVIKLYQKKYHKEPSKTWVSRELDVVLWDFSSNTRCEWHEENDILCCALASCKKIAYCISKSLAGVYGVSLTAAHLPLKDCVSSGNTNLRRVILDAGRFQELKAEGSGSDRHVFSPSGVQELVPSSCEFETSPFVKGKRCIFIFFFSSLLHHISMCKIIFQCITVSKYDGESSGGMIGCTGECKASWSQRIAQCCFPPIENSSSDSMQKSRYSIKKCGGSVIGLLVLFWRHKLCIRNMDIVFSLHQQLKDSCSLKLVLTFFKLSD
uniref:Maelstrom spermatogenic transposon silencer n=1 Tax=Meleagris gallopavo TaxID=9103 RepID=G1NNP4_MELGA